MLVQRNELNALARVRALINALDDVIWEYVSSKFSVDQSGRSFTSVYSSLKIDEAQQSYASKGVCFFSRALPYHRLNDVMQLDAYRTSLQLHLDAAYQTYQNLAAQDPQQPYFQQSFNQLDVQLYSQSSKLIEIIDYISVRLEWQSSTYTRVNYHNDVSLLTLGLSGYSQYTEDWNIFSTVHYLRGARGNSELADLIQKSIVHNSSIKLASLSRAIRPCLQTEINRICHIHMQNRQQFFSAVVPVQAKNTQLNSQILSLQQLISMLQGQLKMLQSEQDMLQNAVTATNSCNRVLVLERDDAVLQQQQCENQLSRYTRR